LRVRIRAVDETKAVNGMDPHLTIEELSRFERRLREDLARHVGEVEAIERDALGRSGGERFQDVDESVEETGLDADLSALATEDQLGYEIRDALERIARGTYGRCEDCGKTVGRQRLEDMPQARLCVSCAGGPEGG
jgi:RNA polymerase-binding transcription factor DksA